MKKFTRLFTLILLIAVLLASASCKKTKLLNAEEAIAAAEEAMNALDSYEMNAEGEAILFINDNRMETTVTGKSIEITADNDHPYSYEKLTTTVKCADLDIDQTSSTLEAYYQGNYFLSYQEEDGHVQKIYSTATVAQIQEYSARKNGNESFSSMMSEAEKSIQHHDDQTSTLTLKSSDSQKIKKMLNLDNTMLEMLWADKAELELTVELDASYRVTRVTMKLLMIEEDTEEPVKDEAPGMTLTYTLSKFNEAQMITEDLNVEEYQQVDSVFQHDILAASIGDYLDSSEGTFTWTSKQSVLFRGQASTNQETDEVSFGIRDGGYFYEVDATTANTTVKLSYANGVQTVVNKGKETENEQTEEDAKSFIANLIKGTVPEGKYVSDVKKQEGNCYKIFYTELPTATYDSVFSSVGGRCNKVEQAVTVLYSAAGELMWIKSTVEATGTIRSGNSIYTITLTIEYEITIN